MLSVIPSAYLVADMTRGGSQRLFGEIEAQVLPDIADFQAVEKNSPEPLTRICEPHGFANLRSRTEAASSPKLN